MILLDGVEYSIQSAADNASAAVQVINDFCIANDIRNRHDEVIQIEPNYANPLYIILLGVGFLVSVCQNLLYSTGCALDIQASSDRQLLNIADVAGIKRKGPTKTVINVTVYSEELRPCNITTDLSVTVNINGVGVVFHPAFDITVPPANARNVVLIAEDLGSYSIAANTITTFDENPMGFRGMVSQASVPGQEQETISSLRQRIQRRTQKGTKQDLASEAIGQLDGVAVCNIFFNQSAQDPQVINGITVPPRQSLLFVQGYSSKIAETYWSYLDGQCAGANAPSAVQQNYVTRSGQSLPVYIIPPELVTVYIRLYFNAVVDDVMGQSMRDAVAELSTNLAIGQKLTSTEVVDKIQSKFTVHPAGCQLSLDNSTYGYQVSPGSYQLIQFAVDNGHIQIIGES